ncbi:MAG: hypothetical protein Q7T69_06500 [Rhodoferax sp.]|nr:hypothetical protein [Rhodoferax sp.]
MTSKQGPTPGTDAQLRQALRASLGQSPADGLNDLQARVMAQWTLRTATAEPVAGGTGGVLQLGLYSVRVQAVLLALVLVAVLGWQSLRNHADTSPDDLLEPDVLALMALGEL